MSVDFALLGQRIREARLAKKLTQEELSEKLDISIAYLSRVERGASHINLTRLNQLCNLLGVSEGELLNGASSISSNYLNKEFSQLLKKCTPEQQRLIFNIAKTILDTDTNK